MNTGASTQGTRAHTKWCESQLWPSHLPELNLTEHHHQNTKWGSIFTLRWFLLPFITHLLTEHIQGTKLYRHKHMISHFGKWNEPTWWMLHTDQHYCGFLYRTTGFSRRSRWMKEGQRDVGWRVTARVQPPTNFNIQPSPFLPSINSLMEAEKEGNIIGGKLPRSLWPEAGWGLQCVCVSRGGQGGRRQHPGRTFGTLFPAALATLLLRLHKSLPAGSMLPSPGGIPLFPKAMPS